MIRLLLALFLAALPGAAQFRSIKIWFTGSGCATCTDSLPERMRRLRGVESAKVDAQESTLELQLAEQNRIRPEQIRDFVEQDGTKALRALVQARGDLSSAGGRWLFKLPGVPSTYDVAGNGLKSGSVVITGEIRELRVPQGSLTIHAAHVETIAAKEP